MDNQDLKILKFVKLLIVKICKILRKKYVGISQEFLKNYQWENKWIEKFVK